MRPRTNFIADKAPYKEFLDPYPSPMTKEAYATAIHLLGQFIGKEVYLATEEDLVAYMGDMRKRNLSNPYMGLQKSCMSAFFRWLKLNKGNPFHRPDNPAEILETIKTKGGQRTRQALNEADRKKIIKALRYDSVQEWKRSMVHWVGIYTGFRRFEMAKLEWAHFDLEKRKVEVMGKGNKFCVIDVPGPLVEWLNKYKAELSKANIETKWLFFNHEDYTKHLSNESIYLFVKQIGKRAGLAKDVKYSTHDLRRQFVTVIVESGKVQPEMGMKMSRHESSDMYRRYARIEQDAVTKQNKEVFG